MELELWEYQPFPNDPFWIGKDLLEERIPGAKPSPASSQCTIKKINILGVLIFWEALPLPFLGAANFQEPSLKSLMEINKDGILQSNPPLSAKNNISMLPFYPKNEFLSHILELGGD